MKITSRIGLGFYLQFIFSSSARSDNMPDFGFLSVVFFLSEVATVKVFVSNASLFTSEIVSLLSVDVSEVISTVVVSSVGSVIVSGFLNLTKV